MLKDRPGEVPGLYDVSFTYPNGGVKALDRLTLAVPQARSIGVIGPSGCGKSTLLSLLAGLARPDGGIIRSAPVPPGRHPMMMVFQKDTLLPWLTVEGNIRLFYKFHPASKREISERVRDLIHMARLTGFETSYPNQLSGGMRKRVAFLSAVAPMPVTLLLDEPFSSLDEPSRVVLHQDVFRITKQLKMTVVLVTHDLAEAISICDEVIILTNRPAQVAARHVVPFGDERNLMELRQQSDFLELYGTLWHELSLQIAQGGAGGA